MLDLETLWQYIRDTFKQDFSPITFKTWIETAHPVHFTDNTLVVEVASPLHRDYWKQSIIPEISAKLSEMLATTITIVAITPDEQDPLEKTPEKTSVQVSSPALPRKNSPLNDKYTFESFVVGKGNQLAHAAALAVAEEPGLF